MSVIVPDDPPFDEPAGELADELHALAAASSAAVPASARTVRRVRAVVSVFIIACLYVNA
ncbi:MAG TPA: hypothetical protein VN969_37665 [Streptosporangiaceae bacterium]|nr:hypothetical protein [Streptosporangiaceae bacterium]